MFNPVIVLVIIIQAVVTRFSRIAGAVMGYFVTTGILMWGITLYQSGKYIALFGIELSEPIFFILCLVWYGFDTVEFRAAQKKAASGDQSKAQLPVLTVLPLWLLVGILVNFSWGPLYSLFNPQYADNLMTVADLATTTLSGLMLGFLQWVLLMFFIPNSNRWMLALWIPASVGGWLMGSMIRAVVAVPDSLAIIVSVISGLTIGILGWLVLRKYCKAAIWWIPACVVDWVVVSLLSQSGIWDSGADFYLIIFLIGLVGSIASTIAIFFILKNTLSDAKSAPGNLSQPAGA